MKRQQFIIQILVSAILITCISSSTKAEIPFTEAKGMYAATKDEYKYISPFWAMVAVHGKLIERIRLYGFYQKVKVREKIIDAVLEQDSIAELLLKLFPSPDGTQLVANTRARDIFGELSRKLFLIDGIIQALVKETERDKKIENVYSTLRSLGKESLAYATLLVDAYEQQEIYAKPGNPAQQRYPRDIVIIALLSFFVKVADHKSDLIKGLPSLFKDEIEEEKKKEEESEEKKTNQVSDNYTKGDYYRYKKAQGNKFSSTIEQIILDPNYLEFIFFMAKGFEKYENFIAEPVGFRTDIKIKEAKEQFSDCGETSLRNFFMLLLSAENGGVVNNDHLNSLEKKVLKHTTSSITSVENLREYKPYKKFKTFITDHRDISEGASDNVHQAWAEVVSKLNSEKESTTINHIQYGRRLKPKSKSTPRVYEIIANCKSTGAISIINMLNVIARIIPDKTLNEPWDDQDKNKRYQQVERKLKRLCKLFSRSKFKVRWKNESTENQTINSDFMVIIFTINDEDAFKWIFEDGHFDIKNINEPEKDWRIKFSYEEFTYPTKPHYYNEWLASLFPRSLDIEEEKKYVEKFPVTVIYNSSLRRLKGIKGTIKIVLKKQMENFYPLISRWVQQSIESSNATFFINIINFLSRLSNNLKEDGLVKEKEVIEKAIENGLYIATQKGILEESILAFALEKNKFHAVMTFIEKKITLDAPYQGNTPLHVAVYKNDLEIANLLIDAGADINRKDNKQNTPLHIAIFRKNVGISKLLIEKGANVNEKNSKDNTPLHTAVFTGGRNILELLIEKGANIDEKNKEGNTALYEAVSENKVRALELLIEKGANINEKNKKGNTPLHEAVSENNIPVLKLLIEKGANINEKNKKGNTPLHVAVSENKVRALKQLIKFKSKLDINMQNEDGNTPLHLAVIKRNLEAVYQLLDNGAATNTINKNGKTLFMSVIDSITEEDIKAMKNALQVHKKEDPDVIEIINMLIGDEGECDEEDDEEKRKDEYDKGDEEEDEEKRKKKEQILEYAKNHNLQAYALVAKFFKKS